MILSPVDRFTPTCVGTATVDRITYAVSPVHPHVRGDGEVGGGGGHGASGSPPRAWGRRAQMPEARSAHAVHPHVRGDGTFAQAYKVVLDGSPPRAWGRRALPGELLS